MININEIKPTISTTYTVGAILIDMWGCEQTNVDFYCIIKVSGDFITVQKMTKYSQAESGFMTRKNTPGQIDTDELTLRKKLRTNKDGEAIGFSFRNYSGGGWCNLWKGDAVTSSHYA